MGFGIPKWSTATRGIIGGYGPRLSIEQTSFDEVYNNYIGKIEKGEIPSVLEILLSDTPLGPVTYVNGKYTDTELNSI